MTGFGELIVTYENDTVEKVVAKNSDMIRFERHFDMPATVMGSKDAAGNQQLRIEWVWYLGYVASRRANPDLPDDFDVWCDMVESIEFVGEADDADPLGRTQ